VNADLTVKLFEKKREIALFFAFIMILFGINLFLSYQAYERFHASKFFHTQATVLNQYQKVSKKGKRYHVLKLKSRDGFTFVTTNYEDIRDLRGREIELGVISERVDFLDFLKSFYAPTFDIELLSYHDSLREQIEEGIKKQHTSGLMGELYAALFLATPISKELRADVSKLGISHLIAISGYHLTFLFGLFYLLFSPVYHYLQRRYFPYRNRRFDLSMVILLLLFWYVWLLDFTPSLIRSFVMLLLGFYLLHRHVRILSFEVLAVSVLLILALKPTLLFSIGFWFSVSGIFYIYLFLHYFKSYPKWFIFIMINIWVYLAMMPIVHFIFVDFSWWQLLSPLLSILFGLFYPVAMLLHLLGLGDMMDALLLKLFALQGEVMVLKTPLWFLALYIFASLLAIFEYRFLLFFSSILFYYYLVI
jgi:competence protein ComEC